MYLNPFDSAHSGQINALDGQATILGLNFGGHCELRFFLFLSTRGGTCLQAVIDNAYHASGTPRHNPQLNFQTPEQKKGGFNLYAA